MRHLNYVEEIKNIKKIMVTQFIGICLTILMGMAVYSIQTLDWRTAIRVGLVLLCVATLGAPLVYARAKQRVQQFSKITTS